jgi:hypothetical protein
MGVQQAEVEAFGFMQNIAKATELLCVKNSIFQYVH